jgi:hypothetical protein
MPVAFVLDEHLRGILWKAIRQHNRGSAYPIDVVRVGDPSDLPLGTSDPEILLWAERVGRILVTCDENTLPTYFAAHLQAGHHSPGVFILRSGSTIPEIVFQLALVAYAGDATYCIDAIQYIP